MADFDITKASATDVAKFIFKEAASTAASDLGGFVGDFIFSEALQLFGLDSSSDESQEIASQLAGIQSTLSDIENKLENIEEIVQLEGLASEAWSIREDITTWYHKLSVIIVKDTPNAKRIDIENLKDDVNDATAGATAKLQRLNDLIQQGFEDQNGVLSGGLFKAFIDALNLPDNRSSSLYDMYWRIQSEANRWYYIQYLGLIVQVNAILAEDPQNTEVAALAFTTYADNILAQENMLFQLIPAFHRIFGEVLKQQGFIRAFMFNAVAINAVSNGDSNFDGLPIPTGDSAYIQPTEKRVFVNGNLNAVVKTILKVGDKSSRQLMRMTRIDKGDGTSTIHLSFEGQSKFISLGDPDLKRNELEIIDSDQPALNWLVWPSSDCLQLLFTVDSPGSSLNGGTWVYNIAEEVVIPPLSPGNPTQTPVLKPMAFTQILPADQSFNADQRLYFNFDWQEEIFQPTVPGQAFAWAQPEKNAPKNSFWTTAFGVRYCYSFLSPLSESPKSPLLVPATSNKGINVDPKTGFLSSGGDIFTMMILPPDPMGLATGYKLYRQKDTDSDWVDITNNTGVIWNGVGVHADNPTWFQVIDASV